MSLPKLIKLTERRDGQDQPVLINLANVCSCSVYAIPITGTPLIGTPAAKQQFATQIQFVQGGGRNIVVETVEQIEQLLQQQ